MMVEQQIRIKQSEMISFDQILKIQYYLVQMQAQKKTNIRLKYFTCNEGGQHEGQSLNYVCLDKKCKNSGVICSICKLNHANHTIVPLKILLTSLKNHNEKPMQNSQGFQNQLEELENQYKLLMHELRKIVDDLADKFRNLEAHIHQQFSKMKVELLERVEINMKFNQFIEEAMKNQIQSRETFVADISRIASMVSIDEKQQIKFETNLTSVVDKFKAFKNLSLVKLNDLINFIQKQELLISTTKQTLSEQIINQNLSSPCKKINYHFASNFKSNSIALQNNNLIAKQTKTGEGRFIFVNKGFGVKKMKIVYKIVHLKNWIGVGIGLRDKIKSMQYRFQYQQLGHGSYLVSSNGYSWSHSEKQDNITVVPFKFNEGDIIEVEYNGTHLALTNRTTKSNHKLKTNWNKTQKNTLFCVNLCSEGDTIQILNE